MLITTFLLAVAQSLVIHENIVFYKQNEVSITRSDWLFTFIIDLKPYENLIVRLSLDVQRHLHGLWHLEKDRNIPLWFQSSMPVMSILLVLLVVFFCVRYKPYQKFWLTKRRGKILKPTAPPAVPVETGDGSHIFRGRHSTQPEISAPMHVTTTSTTEATPLVYPVIELAAVPARDRPT